MLCYVQISIIILKIIKIKREYQLTTNQKSLFKYMSNPPIKDVSKHKQNIKFILSLCLISISILVILTGEQWIYDHITKSSTVNDNKDSWLYDSQMYKSSNEDDISERVLAQQTFKKNDKQQQNIIPSTLDIKQLITTATVDSNSLIIPKLFWVYPSSLSRINNHNNNQNHQQQSQTNNNIHKLLLNSWQKITKQVNYKLIILTQQNIFSIINQQSLTQIKTKISIKTQQLINSIKNENIIQQDDEINNKKNISKIKQSMLKKYIKIWVLTQYGGIWIDENMLLSNELTKIEQWLNEDNHQTQINNMWGQQPQVMMFTQTHKGDQENNRSKNHNNNNKQHYKDNKSIPRTTFQQLKPLFFTNYYNSIITQGWYLRYSQLIIVARPQSRLFREWLYLVEQYLDISHSQAQAQTQSKQLLNTQHIITSNECSQKWFSSSNNYINIHYSHYQSISSQFNNLFDCLLNSRQHLLTQVSHFQNQKTLELDFYSAARYYNIWSVNMTRIAILQRDLNQMGYHVIELTQEYKRHEQQETQPLGENQNEIPHNQIYEQKHLEYKPKIMFVTIAERQKDVTEQTQKHKSQSSNDLKSIPSTIVTQLNKLNITQIISQSKISLEQLIVIKKQKQSHNDIHSQSSPSITTFQIPKSFYLILPHPTNTHFSTLILSSIQQKSLQSNYTMNIVTFQNYQKYFTTSISDKIKNVFMYLDDQKLHNDDSDNNKRQNKQPELKSYQQYQQNLTYTNKQSTKDDIKKRFLMYFLVNENGGIVINSQHVIIQENIDQWIQRILITKSLYLNNGDKRNLVPKYLFFYNSQYSSDKQLLNIQRDYQVEKQLRLYPAPDDSFLAGVKNGQFLTEFMQTYLDILYNESLSKYVSLLDRSSNKIGRTRTDDLFKEGHLVAWHIVLQQRQKLLDNQQSSHDQLTPHTKYRNLAIDSYGLLSVCSLSTINKWKQYNQRGGIYKWWSMITKLTLHEVSLQLGPLRFLTTVDQQIVTKIQNLLTNWNPTVDNYILESSFLNIYLIQPFTDKNKLDVTVDKTSDTQLFNYLQSLQIVPSTHVPYPNVESTAQQWTQLTKKVWVVWDNGIQRNSNPLVQLTFQNLKRSAQASGFEIHIVSKHNLRDYLDDEILQRINEAIDNSDFEISRQAVTDMWRLALIYKYGGIYLDVSTFTTNFNFDWLRNIARLPKNLIYNRYGSLPAIVMYFNGHYGLPYDWHIDQEHNYTKSQWHLSHQNNFIAAAPKQQLLKQWLNTLIEWIQISWPQTVSRLKSIPSLYQHKFTIEFIRYLTAMQSLKYVMGKKQMQLQSQQNPQYRNAAHYYKLWSMSGHMNGQQKFRYQNNYLHIDYRIHYWQKNSHNIFMEKYPLVYVEQVIGPIMYQTKFFSEGMAMMNSLMDKLLLRDRFDLTNSIHPESILAKCLNITPSNTQKLHELIEFYSKIVRMRLKFKALQRAWY